MSENKFEKIIKTDDEWRLQLTPIQYAVTRQQATERPFTGEYVYHKAEGTYHCIACDLALFSSDTKFDSGCGWPSFWDMVEEGTVEFREDRSHGMVRVETVCSRCGAHLGHVFEDGPRDKTGQRYCINSVAIKFKPKEDAS